MNKSKFGSESGSEEKYGSWSAKNNILAGVEQTGSAETWFKYEVHGRSKDFKVQQKQNKT